MKKNFDFSNQQSISDDHQSAAFCLLFVDDEPSMLRLLEETFAEEDYRIRTAGDGQEALALLEKIQVDAAVIDLAMPQMDGFELLKRIRKQYPALMVVILTGEGGVQKAVAAIKMGADDFLEKPFSPEELRLRVAQLFKFWELKQENQRLREEIKNRFVFPELVGNSTTMLKLKELIADAGRTDSPVLIQAETGTGKELVARALHQHSTRSKHNFLPVDCAAISDTVIESELFGHVKGAFTGAHTSTLGLIRAADKGTLFLDEIGELSPAIQAKLLRTLQEKEVRPVGSSRNHPVDVRILAATNRDLSEQLSQGNFREDLFYRINVLTIKVPPLRDRKEDLPLLARYFLTRFGTDLSPVKDISQAALMCLENYEWPGNVRELENIIRRSVALGKADMIRPEDLPQHLYARPICSNPDLNLPADDSLQAFEIAALRNALAKSSNSRSGAARLLGIGEATLYRKIKRYGIRI